MLKEKITQFSVINETQAAEIKQVLIKGSQKEN